MLLYKKTALCNNPCCKEPLNFSCLARQAANLRPFGLRLAGHRGTSPEIVVVITDAPAADVEPTAGPARTHRAATRIKRARKRPVIDVQVFACFIKILELVEHVLQDGFILAFLLTALVVRLILVFLIGFLSIADPNGVCAVFGIALVGLDGAVQVFPIAPAGKLLFAGVVDLIPGQPPGYNDEPVKAVLVVGNFHSRQIRREVEVLLVESTPLGELFAIDKGQFPCLGDDRFNDHLA